MLTVDSGIPEHFDFIPKHLDYQDDESSSECTVFSLLIHEDCQKRSALSHFLDGSKLGRVDVGVLCRLPSINYSFRLPEHSSVFQAKVTAIKVAVDQLLLNAASFRVMTIHSDSRAAI